LYDLWLVFFKKVGVAFCAIEIRRFLVSECGACEKVWQNANPMDMNAKMSVAVFQA
jgi:hypothetical protein